MANAQLLTCFDFSITIYCQTTCLECADDSASSHSPISSFVSFNTPPVPTYPSIPILFLHTLLPFALHPLSLSHNFLPPFLLNSIFCLSSSNYLFLPHFFLASSLHPFLFLTLLKEKKTVHVVMSDQEIQIPLAYQHSLTFSWVWIAPLPLVFLPQPLSHILLGALCSSIPFYLLALFL